MKRLARLTLLRLAGWLLRRIVPSDTTVQAERAEILLIRPDHLGDVLLSRPAIDALARTLPDAHLTIAVGPWGRPALGQMGDRTLLICPFPGFSRDPMPRLQRYLLLARYALLLRRHRHTMAVILRSDHWWGALLACLAGIPARVGYSTPETAPFLTVSIPHTPGQHAVTVALDLAEAAAHCAGVTLRAGDSTLPTSAADADRDAVTRLLQEAGVSDEPLLVLHPAAGSPLKAWPLERFAALGTAVSRSLGARVVVTGSAGERPLAQRLCDLLAPGTLNLAGRLSWTELEALLARATLVIGVDSGPLHLAAAVRTPSLALFGPADPAQFAPWGPPAQHRVVHADLPCRPCRRLDICRLEPAGKGPPPCMRAIEVETVLAAAQSALQNKEHLPDPVR